jgi:tetratricopeptide (TPR) repeat protein
MLPRAVALALLSLTLAVSGGRLAAQEEAPPAEPPAEPSDSAPSEETASDEPPPSGESDTSETADEAAPAGEESAGQQPAPAEEVGTEESRRRREERQARREAKKEREKLKVEDKLARAEGDYEQRLAGLLEKGYAALDAQEYKKALQAFEARLALEDGTDFAARMGLAWTLSAMGDPVGAIDSALRAARQAERDDQRSEALVFAGDLSLRSIPHDESTRAPLPGGELYVTTAHRYYVQAVRADPEGADEARQRLEEIYPTPPDERTERLYARFVELAPNGAIEHARYLAAAYEALISGSSSVPVAVAGGISAPVKDRGPRPPYPRPPAGDPPRRILASLIIEPDGTVSQARILNGVDERHDQPAVDTFRSWTFEPARLPDGTPVPVHYLAGTSPTPVDPLPPDPPAESSEAGDPSGDPGDEGEPEDDQ